MTPTERAAYRHECRQQRFVVPASTRRHFSRKLEHRAFVDVAAAMMQRMHAHLSQGEPGIPVECLTLIFDLAGVSRSRGYDAWGAIQDRGMATVENGFVIFDFRTVKQGDLCPTVGRSLKGLVNPTGREWNDTSNPPGPILVPDAFASGEGDGSGPEPLKGEGTHQVKAVAELVHEDVGLHQEQLGEEEVGDQTHLKPSGMAADCKSAIHPEPKKPSLIGQAVAELVAAGADRAGAVKAAKVARQAGHLDLGRVRAIAEAVKGLPAGSSYRPGGLLCAAVKRPDLGQKLLRDHQRQVRRSELAAHNRLVVGSNPTAASVRGAKDYETFGLTPSASGLNRRHSAWEADVLPLNYARGADRNRCSAPEPRWRDSWEAALATVRSWAGMVHDADDLAFLLTRTPSITAEHIRAAMPSWATWL